MPLSRDVLYFSYFVSKWRAASWPVHQHLCSQAVCPPHDASCLRGCGSFRASPGPGVVGAVWAHCCVSLWTDVRVVVRVCSATSRKGRVRPHLKADVRSVSEGPQPGQWASLRSAWASCLISSPLLFPVPHTDSCWSHPDCLDLEWVFSAWGVGDMGSTVGAPWGQPSEWVLWLPLRISRGPKMP